MTIAILLSIALAVFVYALFSARLGRRGITAPMVFVAVGWLIGPSGFGLLAAGFDERGVGVLAEVTLVLVLFADATRIDLSVLRRQLQLPARLLGIGLPLTIVLGGAVAGALLDQISMIEAFLIGAILAPTDAALGQAVVSNPEVPVRIRQALNVESGLNDGIVLPAVTALAAFAASNASAGAGDWIETAAAEVGFGVLFGVLVGGLCGAALRISSNRGWIDGVARQLATLAVPGLAYTVTHFLAGNGFIASFVAGIAFGWSARAVCEGVQNFTEDEGQLLTWVTFLLFGVALVGPALEAADWRMLIYVILSLTVIRGIPVALACIGTGLMRPSVLFLGWFGPRGLASLLFVLLILDKPVPGRETVLAVVTLTVLVSVFAHGFTARPLARRYGQAVAKEEEAAEHVVVEEMPAANRVGFTPSGHQQMRRRPDLPPVPGS